MTASARELLQTHLTENAEQIRSLERQFDALVAASDGANVDDEHDPEGSTVAFERQQVVSLVERSRKIREDILRAMSQLDEGTYGECERCGQAIGVERLEARPDARTCIACASKRR